MRPEHLLPLFISCLDALGEAHELGIVHKDLKPSNLFLSDPGTRSEALRIVDFGIAHIKNGPGDAGEQPDPPEAKERSGRLTATGQILGTLQYLTPEYIASQTVTPALDVYQMALILVELLSGDRVIKTDNPFECLRIHTFGLLELPEYLLASPLGPVLRHALASEVSERIPDANAFAEALSEIDPAAIPPSPLFEEGGAVKTAQFLDTKSHGAIPRPSTGELKPAPNTGQHQVEDIGLVPTIDPSDAPAAISKEPLPAIERDLAPALTGPVDLDEDAGGNDGLKVALGALVALILLAVAALGFLATRGGDEVADPDPEPIAEAKPAVEDKPAAPEPTPDPTPAATPDPEPVADPTPAVDPTPAPPSCDAGPKEYCVRFVGGPDGTTAAVKGPVEVVDADALLYKVTRKSSKVSFVLDAPGHKSRRLRMKSMKLRAGQTVDVEVSLSEDARRPSKEPVVATKPDDKPDEAPADLVGALDGIKPDPKPEPKPDPEPRPTTADDVHHPILGKVEGDKPPIEKETKVIIEDNTKKRKGDGSGFGVIDN
jgi:serine/threonine protein kinase